MGVPLGLHESFRFLEAFNNADEKSMIITNRNTLPAPGLSQVTRPPVASPSGTEKTFLPLKNHSLPQHFK